MSITIIESGLQFGEYEENRLFHAEQSMIYRSLGKGISTVEFVLFNDPIEILMIEAKSSSPQPSNQENFDDFIEDIYRKFAHSVDTYFSLVLNRLQDKENEMPECFRTADYSISKIRLILVINGHRIAWLPPIRDAIRRKLDRQVKIWRLEIAVINHLQARELGLLV